MDPVFSQLQKRFPRLELQKSLASLTTFQVGGPADLYYELLENTDLPDLIKEAKANNIPYMLLGGGSNIIFSDEGYRGLIIHLKAKKSWLRMT